MKRLTMVRVIEAYGGTGAGPVKEAARVLAAGGVAVVPTDTVYGVCALATDREAVARVLKMKERPSDKPLPVLVESARAVGLLACADTPGAAALMQRFWPGALTLVLRRKPGLELPFQKPETIGLRVPDHPLTVALLAETGPVVASSANNRGAPPPVSAEEVAMDLAEKCDIFLDAGRCPGGVESTVVALDDGIRIIREGAVPAGAVLETWERSGDA